MRRARTQTTIKFVGRVDRAAFEALVTEERRRDACQGHRFVRVQREPPKWYCPNCDCAVQRQYLRAFERGLVAAGADPSKFIADYGEWP